MPTSGDWVQSSSRPLIPIRFEERGSPRFGLGSGASASSSAARRHALPRGVCCTIRG